MGIFKRSFADISNAVSVGGIRGGFNSMAMGITQQDIANINEYNRLVGVEGVSSQTAWNRTMLTSSSTAQGLFDNQENLVRSGHGLVLSQEAISNATQKMTVKMKLAEVGMKALSIAGNMLLFMGISMAISGVIKGIDYLIHREEKLQEALDESISALESTTSEIENLEEQVKTCAERIAELQKLKDAGTISLADEEELNNLKEENKELERQIALLQDKQIREGKQVLKDAKKQEDDKVQSRYKLGHKVTPAQELHGAVQGFIYAQNTDNDALADEHGARVEDMYEKIQPTLEAYRALEEAGYDLSDAEEEHYAQLKKAEDEYLLYTHLLNGTKESFVALSEEMQKQVLIRDLFYKKGMTQEQATAVVENIKPEDYVKMWESDFEFTPPDPNDYDSAEEYGKAYADAWIKGAQEGVEENANKMTVSLSEMADASDKVSSLSSAFKELSNDGYITTETIAKIQEATGLSGVEWDNYQSKLMNAKKGSAEFNQVMSDLTFRIIDSKFNLEGLKDATEAECDAVEKQIAATLRENGVVNANAVAQSIVTQAKRGLKIAYENLTYATYEEINALIDEGIALGYTSEQMFNLIGAHNLLNSSKLNLDDKIAIINRLGDAGLIAASKVAYLIDLLNSASNVGRTSTVLTDGDRSGAAELDLARELGVFSSWNKIDIPEFEMPDFSGASSGGKSGSDNKPDYEDPTDAIIDRINLRQRELSQQEEEIQNLIEIAELEKDYKKQISLTNDKLDVQRQKVDALKTANDELHKMAEDLRNSTPQWSEEEWFNSQGQATEEYNSLYNNSSKEEQEKIKDQFEKISKIKEAWVENDEERLSLTKEILQTEEDIVNLRKEQFDKANDFGSSYLDSRKTLLESYYDVTNSIAEAQHEINKELKASKTMYEYLDEDTRKLLFNQEDYNALSKELIDIQSEADRLKRQYEYDLDHSTLDTIEEITSNYEMQYEMLMKSYEIAKADLEIAKKKQKLDNVLNEKNVRMLINGQWQWVANTQDVINAKAELADAEYAKRVEESGLTQQKSIDAVTKKQNQLGTIISQFSNGVISLDDAIGNIVSRFRDLPDNILNSLKGISSSSSSSSSSGTYYSYSGRTLQVNADGTAPSYAKKGDIIKTAGGDYLITGGTAGNFSSIKIKERHADGTRYTPGGMTALGEEDFEAFIDNNGHLIPINQPTIGNIGAGGIVFNQDQMTNLRSLWDLSNIGTMSNTNISNITNRQMSETINYQLFGDMIFDGNNPEEIFRKMADFFKNTRYKSN